MLTEYEIVLLVVAWICSVAGAYVMGSKAGYSDCEKEFKLVASILQHSDIPIKDLDKEDHDDGR